MLKLKVRKTPFTGLALWNWAPHHVSGQAEIHLMAAITIKQACIPSQRSCCNSHCPNGMAHIMIAIPSHISIIHQHIFVPGSRFKEKS
jgi:hypothetical protein